LRKPKHPCDRLSSIIDHESIRCQALTAWQRLIGEGHALSLFLFTEFGFLDFIIYRFHLFIILKGEVLISGLEQGQWKT
jgi:hypothetical protein